MVRLHGQHTPIGKEEMPMHDKPVALVTGANQGTDLQIAKDRGLMRDLSSEKNIEDVTTPKA
jgi:hypothetical protein